MKRITHFLSVAVVVAGTTATARAEITIKGSDTLVILAQKWAEVYMTKNPQVKIQVTGGGSGVGLAALQNQSTDIANASRKIKAAEIANCLKNFGRRPTEYKVALDGITVYVNKANPINELTIDQLARIFTGKIKNWKDVGGPDARITIYSRENSSGTYEFFKEHILEGRDFASSAQTMQGTAAIIQAVAKDKRGIGYGGAGYGAGSKHLKVKKTDRDDAIEPTLETVVNGTYPIWRYLYVYLNPDLDKGEIADYIHWIRSDEGQELVQEVGYFPLPPQFRAK